MTAARKRVSLCTGTAVVVALLAVSACTSRSLTNVDAGAPNTVSGVGALPGSTLSDPSGTGVPIVSLPHAAAGPIGSRLTGNRVILIGDSIMTSISHRYGDQACKSLVPLGWQVEVDAETGRFIPFGHKVLDKRLAAGWDAAVILLGNNYLFNKQQYQDQLHLLLARLAPRPTVLLTTTMFRPAQSNVNSAIVAEGALFPNVTIIDWASITEDTSLTGADGLHLTEKGRIKLADTIALVLGPVTGTGGKCLKTDFHDDSMGSPTGTNGSITTVPKSKTSTGSSTTSTFTTDRTGGGSTTTPSSVGSGVTTTTQKSVTTTTATTKPPSSTSVPAPTTTVP
jgi:hypothetical protein